MASLLANTGLDSLIAFSSLFVGLAIGVVLVWCVGAFTTLLFGRITPIHLSRKLIGLSPLVFSVSSSHARLIFVLKFCTEKLGIDSNLSAFSIPVGVQLNKAGNCIFFSLVTLMMMRVYNIELTPALFIILLISVCIMAIAKPPVPCGGIICIAYLFTVVGVPPEAISVILCVDPIAAMFNGVSNESANITTSFILAKTNSMLDKEKYFAR
jgi:Na+/H+-dicarboxylate symporter